MARTLLVSALLLLAGCATPKQDAKALFEQGVAYHQQHSFTKAANTYERLLKTCRDQPYWCAQALRSLGNVRAAQGRLDEAIQLYRRVGEQYRRQDWEVLQAWKSAADLLWEAGREEEARAFDRQIVARFDIPDASAIVKNVVRGSQRRL